MEKGGLRLRAAGSARRDEELGAKSEWPDELPETALAIAAFGGQR